jgi:ubiquinone/menaquinone biosynthesis C-methylase UbiE
MSIQKAYDDWSSSYDIDTNLTRDLDGQITQQLLANQRFHSILEIGCGTGKNTSFLAQIGASVQALDFSEGMIAKAMEKVNAGNVRFAMADLTRRWPSADGSHDLIVCNLVLEHIQDLAFVFSEAVRVLAGGCRFLINELHPFRQYEGKKARFDREDGVTEIPAFIHHMSDFTNAASGSGLRLILLSEHWHSQDDSSKPPRILSLLFEK